VLLRRWQEVIPEWQQAASTMLVSLGMRFPKQLMEELMKRFSPGTVPHYFVMKTMGDFASANGAHHPIYLCDCARASICAYVYFW
jgi:hypothetical protein